MRIFIARHGQISFEELRKNHIVFSENDPPISSLGKEQAKRLAKEMQRLDFKGKIYASPFLRTIMTADSVSQLLDIPIHTRSELREIVSNEEIMEEFKGLSLDELKKLFPRIAEDAELPYPWWKTEVEDLEAVKNRVHTLLEDLIKKQEDVLLVGHGASVVATFYCLLDMANKPLEVISEWYNCSLSHFTYSDGRIEPVTIADTSHLTNSMLTDNDKRALDNIE